MCKVILLLKKYISIYVKIIIESSGVMRKKYLLIGLLFIAIGFATVTTTLLINGTSTIKKKDDSFKVYYSDALVNGSQDLSVVVDDTHLSFKTTLDTLGQTYVLDYDVTNSSKQYDAQLTMNCTGGNEYLTVVNTFNTVDNLLATDTRRGKLTLTLAKSYSGADMDVEIVCTLGANAVERNSEATGTPKDPVAVCKWEYEDLDESGSLTVGDRYAKCEDAFYVTDVTEDNVELLTAQALTSEYRQVVPGETYADYVDFVKPFGASTSSPWPKPSDTFDIDVFTYSETIPPYINGYVEYLKQLTGDNTITGDLINLPRLLELGCDMTSYTCSTSPYVDWLNLGYEELWYTKTGEKTGQGIVYSVKEDFLFQAVTIIGHAEAGAIRPVITISRDTLNRLTNTEPVLDPTTFCESHGFTHGMLNPSSYRMGVFEDGDIADAYYLCSFDEDFSCPLYGYDINGEEVYSKDGGCPVEG